MFQRYLGMHELSRHVNHASETLGAAVETLTAMIDNHHNICCGQPGRSVLKGMNNQGAISQAEFSIYEERLVHSLKFSACFLANLQRRAQSFEKRLWNETKLVSPAENLCAYLI